MEASTRHQVLNMTWSKFWSKAYCGVPANLQDFILGASPLDETLGVNISSVMVFLDSCDDVLDRYGKRVVGNEKSMVVVVGKDNVVNHRRKKLCTYKKEDKKLELVN